MRITHDREQDMAYVYLTCMGPGEAAKQVRVENSSSAGDIILDFDRQGRLLGFEVFNASKVLPTSLLEPAVHPRKDVEDP